MLEIDKLHAGYSGNEVLHGVSLDVAEGEMVAIIGPNGAGKSTLLNCIAGDIAARQLDRAAACGQQAADAVE